VRFFFLRCCECMHYDLVFLTYRSDLLGRTRYSWAPKPWDELEKMATTDQTGERAKRSEDFEGCQSGKGRQRGFDVRGFGIGKHEGSPDES